MAKNSHETSDTHFFGVGLQNPKNPFNIGAAIRSLGCFGGSFFVSDGDRYRENKADFRNMDTEFARKKLPIFLGVQSLWDYIPYDVTPVVLERNNHSVPLPEFNHPRRALYIFGPEDGSVVVPDTIECEYVSIPTSGSLNVAASSYITLYDRACKSQKAFSVDSLQCPLCGSIHLKTATDASMNNTLLNHCNACGHEWETEI